MLAFVGCWLAARRLGLNNWGSLLAALVYVYGWFPPRACLEWAIIGGAYLPLTLWCLEGWFQTRHRRHCVGLALLLALDLLAGHYNLAFITLAALGLYVLARPWMAGAEPSASLDLNGLGTPNAHTASLSPASDAPISLHLPSGGEGRGERESSDADFRRSDSIGIGPLLFPALYIAIAFGLAAPQLLPSWHLKQMSQRTETNAEFDPGYGHIPPWYLCQVATPWLWFGSDANPDQALNTIHGGGIASATNKVEAHLYFGLLPLLLAIIALTRGWFTGDRLDPRLKLLAWIGLFGMIYATGWLLPIAKHLPGFGYFRGPGRWGILTTLGVALLSGSVLSRWTDKYSLVTRRSLAAITILVLTMADLFWVSQHQWYTFHVSDPPIAHHHESAIGRMLSEWESNHGPARMLAPGPNLATLTGIAAAPPYLGFGPDAYYEEGGRLPDPRFLQYLSGETTPDDVDIAPQFTWLRNAGVTHILSMKPLPRSFPVQKIWSGVDRLLNPAWARMSPAEPLYLYEVDDHRGRVFLDGTEVGTVRIVRYSANRIEIEVDCPEPCELVLTDLPWPDWRATLDGAPVEVSSLASNQTETDPETAGLLQRRLQLTVGRHRATWRCKARMLKLGALIAVAAALLLVVTAFRRLRPAEGGHDERKGHAAI